MVLNLGPTHPGPGIGADAHARGAFIERNVFDQADLLHARQGFEALQEIQIEACERGRGCQLGTVRGHLEGGMAVCRCAQFSGVRRRPACMDGFCADPKEGQALDRGLPRANNRFGTENWVRFFLRGGGFVRYASSEKWL